jgi:proteasome component ECM29
VYAVEELLARCMSTACTVLKSFASRCNTSSADRAVSGSNDGSVAVRDSCYGVVATLSRSQLCNSRSIFLFNCGIASKEARLDSSVETASLLFQCTACEEERLRPRAVAALDSLLAAYCRACIAIPVVKAQYKEDFLDTGVGVDVKYSSNPWLSTPTTVPEPLLPVAERDSLRVDGTGLANALLPLLWNAAHNFQPKASRLAAARWASDLLKELDLVCGYHLLCFLAGDPDSSSASIAREGLGLSKLSEISHESALTSVPADFVPGTLPDFGTFVDKMFKLDTPIAGRQLHYWDFPLKGKAATLRFSLRCLSNDLYGGENKAVATYLSTILKTLQEIPGDTTVASASPAAQGGGTFIDLLDECAACLLVTLTTSSFARDELSRRDTACSFPCSVGDIESFAIRSSSSKARRYFASACGQVLENSLPHGAGETFDSFLEWIDRSNLLNSLTMCSQSLREVELQHATPSALHGSAFLGAHLVRAFRLRSAHVRIIRDSKSVDGLWSYVSNVLTLLGKGLQHRDDIVANACADSLAIALSFESPDAPFLDERLYECSTSVLNQLAAGLSLFGHSDTVNPTRTTKIARAAGVILAATTAGADNGNNDIGLGRMACVDALFQLLGSMASRKEEELALVVGEALADYADGYSPENVVWTNSGKIWPYEFDEHFAKGLPPHEQVLYVLLRRLYPSSDPHKKIACAPALLAVVAMGARRVSRSDESCFRFPLVFTSFNSTCLYCLGQHGCCSFTKVPHPIAGKSPRRNPKGVLSVACGSEGKALRSRKQLSWSGCLSWTCQRAIQSQLALGIFC